MADIETHIFYNNFISIDELYTKCKSGDIICFRLFNYKTLIIRAFSNFTHVGIVYEDISGNKYLLESHGETTNKNYGIESESGIHLYPLKYRLKHSIKMNTSAFYLPLNLNISNKIKKHINSYIDYYISIPFDDNYQISYLQQLINTIFSIKTPYLKNKFFCSSLVGDILLNINIIKNINKL